MYGDWFQLVQRPFGTAPDGKVYFPSHGIEAARSAMTRCIDRGGGPGLVIGGTGVGKTTLAMKLIDQFRACVPVAYLSGRGIVSRRELLQTVLFELGRPYGHDEGELRLELIDVLTSSDASQKRTLLVIDDADQFSVELLGEVSAVSSLARDGFWSTDVVLLGTVRLEEALASPSLVSLANRIAARYYLHPLGFEETEAYVQYQVQQIGGGSRAIFTEDAIGEILETSGGVPRTINQLCDHALMLAMSHGLKHVNAVALQEAWLDLQQLPPAETSTNEEPAESFIEFGALDGSDVEPDFAGNTKSDDDERCGEARDVERLGNPDADLFEVGSQTRLFPDVALDTIERQVAEIVEVHDRRASDDNARLALAESASFARNPFLESFDEEEVVLDLPLGLRGISRPAMAGPAAPTPKPAGDDGLLEEVLRQMGQLEHRSLMLNESITSAQEDLEKARNPAWAEQHSISEAVCAGNAPDPWTNQDLGLDAPRDHEVAARPTSDQGQSADPPIPTKVSDDNSIGRSEYEYIVQSIETVSEMQIIAVDDVVPCESIDCASPAAVEPHKEEPVEVAQHLDEQQPENEPVAERAEPEGASQNHAAHREGGRHEAEVWPPQQKRPRYRRLFVNLRNQ